MKISAAERKFMRRVARRGGHARALSLSPERRREIAVHAITTRWARVRAQQASEQQAENAQQPAAAKV